jgi:hypothetical protein
VKVTESLVYPDCLTVTGTDPNPAGSVAFSAVDETWVTEPEAFGPK